LSDDLILDIRVGATDIDNMDCVSFAGFLLGQLCAYEPDVPGQSNIATAQLWGIIGSLIPTEFRDVQGGLVIPASSPAAVPEPASLVLVGTGLATILRRRRSR